MGGRLLVPDKDMLHFVLIEYCIVYMKGCPTGVAEYELYAFVVQCTQKHVTTRK
jgi:hypothetical protein